MHLISFHDWIRRIYATRDDELDCDEIFERLPQYVDSIVAGQADPPGFSQVEDHLRQCPYCYDLYLALRDTAALEAQQDHVEVAALERCERC
jgi:predicted anti-sigma-YlaC factor YlaD